MGPLASLVVESAGAPVARPGFTLSRFQPLQCSWMRIAIDARKLHDYGIGTYVRNLVRQLAKQDGPDTYALICR